MVTERLAKKKKDIKKNKKFTVQAYMRDKEVTPHSMVTERLAKK